MDPSRETSASRRPDGGLRRGVRAALLSTLAHLRPVVEAVYGGLGTILAFHRVVERRTGPHLDWMQSLETGVDELESILRHVTRSGRALLSLDEIAAGLRRGTLRHSFVAFTFDDGYRDNLTLALPLFEAYHAPFAVYVTTDFPDHRATMWWYAAEEALLRSSRLEFVSGNEHHSYAAEKLLDKVASFLSIQAAVRYLAPDALEAFANDAFGAARMRELRGLALSWDDLRDLSRSPLVTIGAHTVTHPALASLTADAVVAEMVGSRRRLESELGRRVNHFAFPFGQRPCVTPRELAIARECGFTTATTTVSGNVFARHAACLEALPRMTYGGESVADLEATVFSGATAVLRHHGRRVALV